MKKIALVALCNNYSRKQDWFPLCVGTWKHCLTGIDKYFVSDGTLNSEQKQEIELLSGGKFLNTELYEETINSILKQYPAIDSQRKLCVFYKRIVDFSVYFSNYDYILSIDTDIGITTPVQLPSDLPDFAFCVDEVPGYSAHPFVAFQTRIITGLNAGFLLFRPKNINFDFIELMTQKYISQGKINWWSEQTCWALIAGHLCQDVRVFSPSSVAIVSGTRKRTLNNIKQNKTTYIGKSKKIEDLQSIEEIIGSAKVIHFAGPGKPWIKPIMGNVSNNNSKQLLHEPELLKFEPLPSFPLLEKFMLFLRLLVQQYK
jgi:hypothetical protein